MLSASPGQSEADHCKPDARERSGARFRYRHNHNVPVVKQQICLSIRVVYLDRIVDYPGGVQDKKGIRAGERTEQARAPRGW